MTLLSDRTGILRTQEAKTFADRFQKRINSRITTMEAAEALALLHAIRENLAVEETAIDRSDSDIEELLNRLAATGDSEELQLLIVNFQQLAAEQFKNRASVSTFLSHYSRFMELLLSHAIATATKMMANDGIAIDKSSWCALVSGKLGRGEASNMDPGKIILIAADHEGISRECFSQFAHGILATLEPLLALGGKTPGSSRNQIWAGAEMDWLELVDAGLSGGKSSSARISRLPDADLFAETFRMIADLKPLFGSMPLAVAVINRSRERVTRELDGESFRQMVKLTTAMPVAIGIFGRIKTARTGRHRGEFPLEELAINPLIAATRVLAIATGITETATTARIKGILAMGNLGVTLADRLLTAYHDFMKTLIELRLNNRSGNEKAFFNPDVLDELAREQFRIGLEEVTTLQRVAYQQLAEGN